MPLEKRVLEILSKSRKEVCEHHGNSFEKDCESEICDLKIESPIERILYVAIKKEANISNIGECDVVEINGNIFTVGLDIKPQFHIGKYRVDFLVSMHSIEGGAKNVVVECDSQEFHDRTELERRHEKERERIIQKLGYKVFRYTGSEIFHDPFKAAKEIMDYISEGGRHGLD